VHLLNVVEYLFIYSSQLSCPVNLNNRLKYDFLFYFQSIGFVYPFLAHWMWGANGWLGAVVGARVCCTILYNRSFSFQYINRTMVVVQ
jgi:hypothetical protein